MQEGHAVEEGYEGGVNQTYEEETQVAELSRWILDLHDYIDEIERRWRGVELTARVREDGTLVEEEVRVSEPLMNEEGIKHFISTLRSLADKTHLLANYTKQEADIECFWFAFYIRGDIFRNFKKYGITAKNRDVVADTCIRMAKAIYSRAVGGQERKIIGVMHKIREVIGGQREERGLFR